jgi:NADH dehydrogenase FAD-containing subunit
MSKDSKTKSVVILGGGHAGTTLVNAMGSTVDPAKYTFTLINDRPFYVFYPPTIRITTSGQHDLDGKSFMPYEGLLKNKPGSFVLGTAKSIKKNPAGGGKVVLENGQRVNFDILALAPGSRHDGPVSIPKTKAETNLSIARWQSRIEAASHIVLVGGGAVGIEYAGEIKDFYPEKRVTIVHGNKQLLNNAYPDKFRRRLERVIRDRDVDIVFNDYVDTIPQGTVSQVITRKGKTIQADLVLSTRGATPNTEFLRSLGVDTLTKTGHVKIRPTLQLLEHPEIFALGDVLDYQEQKQAAKVGGHAKVVAANIASLIDGQDPKAVYRGAPEMIVITNGKNGGVTYMGFLWGIMLGDWFTRTMKSKELLIPMARKAMGLSS